MSASDHLGPQFMGIDDLKASRSQDFGGTVGEMKSKWLADSTMPTNPLPRHWSPQTRHADAGGPQAYVDQLADSISREGVKKPLEFVANKDYEGNTYQLLMDGHHRALAAMQAGVDKVPVKMHPDYDSFFKGRLR